MYPLSNSNPVFDVLSTWKLQKNKNTTGYYGQALSLLLYGPPSKLCRHVMTSSKIFKLQTRKFIRQKLSSLFHHLEMLRNFNPEIFAANFFKTLKLNLWFVQTTKLCFSFVTTETHLIKLSDCSYHTEPNWGGSLSASPPPEIKHLHIHPVLSNHEYM